jgi:glycosyltransferase involved in cell wall biosynthesis
VLYGTDCSIHGHRDQGFDQVVAWDTPLLDGYQSLVLNNEHGTPLRGFRSVTGRGILALLKRERPTAVLMSQFLYELDFAVYFSCRLLRIPIWIRQETQDDAFRRPAWKTVLRSLGYRLIYSGVSHAFAIGWLSNAHLRHHGIEPDRISVAHYCVADPIGALPGSRKEFLRNELRDSLKVGTAEKLLLFAGKLMDKKNPVLLLDTLRYLDDSALAGCKVLFVGSGPLQASLREAAAPYGNRVLFAGFINQSELPAYYLAADILILPSRRAGETWGLVVNEALHAGCAVVVTDAVGCHREFGAWERVRVIPENDSKACADAVRALSTYPRSFDWCVAGMQRYSVEAAAGAIAEAMNRFLPPQKDRKAGFQSADKRRHSEL